MSLYTATGGATWHPTSSLIAEPGGWLNTNAAANGLPSHCSWSGVMDASSLRSMLTVLYHELMVYGAGVFCCVSSGLPDGYPQLILDLNPAH